MGLQGGDHSFECWATNTKLCDQQRRIGHRKDISQGPGTFYALIIQDAEKARRKCKECQRLRKNKNARDNRKNKSLFHRSVSER